MRSDTGKRKNTHDHMMPKHTVYLYKNAVYCCPLLLCKSVNQFLLYTCEDVHVDQTIAVLIRNFTSGMHFGSGGL